MKAKLGSVLFGTTKPDDRLEVYAQELMGLKACPSGEKADLVADAFDAADRIREAGEGIGLEGLNELLSALQDMLTQFSPEYIYFGPSPDDPACHGFWLDWGAIENDQKDGWLAMIGDPSELDSLEVSQAIYGSDHGNLAYYEYDPGRGWELIWDAV